MGMGVELTEDMDEYLPKYPLTWVALGTVDS